ncbi:MAG TPA: NAD(P)H-hydrate dehydratase [Dehalococcoidia bacterium]
MKLVTTAEMRAIEEAAFRAGFTATGLMENAGRAIAEAVRDHLGSARARRVLVLVGPGNNGGDGLVAARYLHDSGADVSVCLLAPRAADDANLAAVRSREIEVIEPVSPAGGAAGALADAVGRADAVIDAVLGIGRQRPLGGAIAGALDLLRSRRAPLFAVDLPTGVDADSGAADPHAAAVDVTLALAYSKIGLHVLPGAACAGRVHVLDIGLDPALGDAIPTELLTEDWARAALPARPAESNKGTFGRVLVVAGSERYVGAAALACLGALRAGAGLVTLAAIDPVRAAVAAQLPEVTYLPLPEADGGIDAAAADVILGALAGHDALLVGPGLGLATGTQALVRRLLASAPQTPVVVDADALNALSRLAGWQDEVKASAVLTPHPGELARLTGGSVAEVQADRLGTARRSAQGWRQTVVLKGASTVVAQPDGRALISPYANAALATAGTGDVLAGAIAGLIAQGVAPFAAAGLGVYLHGAAAASFEEEYGASGLLASELGAAIARVAARLRRGE